MQFLETDMCVTHGHTIIALGDPIVTKHKGARIQLNSHCDWNASSTGCVFMLKPCILPGNAQTHVELLKTCIM